MQTYVIYFIFLFHFILFFYFFLFSENVRYLVKKNQIMATEYMYLISKLTKSYIWPINHFPRQKNYKSRIYYRNLIINGSDMTITHEIKIFSTLIWDHTKLLLLLLKQMLRTLHTLYQPSDSPTCIWIILWWSLTKCLCWAEIQDDCRDWSHYLYNL
jgi:hypothetical protein